MCIIPSYLLEPSCSIAETRNKLLVARCGIYRGVYIHIWKQPIGIVHDSHVVFVRVFGFSLNSFIAILTVDKYRRFLVRSWKLNIRCVEGF